MEPAERLERKLVRQSNDCLEWTGGRDRDGYGRVQVAGKRIKTHRLAWTLANGAPNGLHVLHHCDNPPCCETEPSEEYPEGHLFLGTNAENIADKIAKGRQVNIMAQLNAAKTHCPQGHPYDAANTYANRGGRFCRACGKAAVARRKARQI
jgi:hypothetical protein